MRVHDGYVQPGGHDPGYDRFGRIGKQMYVDGGYTTGSGSNPNVPQIHYRKYAYDKLSNRLSDVDARPGIDNSPAQTLGSKQYYDGLNRLKQVDRGIEISSTWTWGTGSQQMSLDVLGNFKTFKLDGDASGSYSAAETETRTHDGVNQFTALDTDGTSNDRSLEYDHNGNFNKVTGTGGGSGTVYTQHTFDAWNRLVKVERRTGSGTPSLQTVAEYQHNALGWRVVRRIDVNALNTSGASGDGVLDQQTLCYYNESWQLLREEIYDGWSESTPGSVDRWVYNTIGLRRQDEVLSRAYWTGSEVVYTYHLHDPQFSTVAVLDETGLLVERVDYSPWGAARHHPFGDVDGDGSGPDQSTIDAIANCTTCSGTPTIGDTYYHAEADLDRDGQVGRSDTGLAGGTPDPFGLQFGRQGDGCDKNTVILQSCGKVDPRRSWIWVCKWREKFCESIPRRMATRNPLLINRLRRGTSPTANLFTLRRKWILLALGQIAGQNDGQSMESSVRLCQSFRRGRLSPRHFSSGSRSQTPAAALHRGVDRAFNHGRMKGFAAEAMNRNSAKVQ